MKQKKIGVFVGSLRKGSYSKAIAKTLASMMSDEFEAEFVEIRDLPLFNQDFEEEGSTPAAYVDFRNQVSKLDGFLFVTPEYNRSYSAAIKNALDVGSRPFGQNLWSGKPGAIVSVSPGRYGGFGANHHLRQSMSFLNVFMMQQPETYIGDVSSMLDDQGNVQNERDQKFLMKIVKEFESWVNRFVD